MSEADEERPLLAQSDETSGGSDGLPNRWTRFTIGVSLGVLLILAGLETSFVVTTSSTTSSDLNNADTATFLGTYYLLAATVAAPVQARLSDNMGRTQVIIGAAIIFTIGTLLCALAPTMELLLLARAVTGIGSGGILIMCAVILSETTPRKSRAFWNAIGNLIVGSAVASGGPLGGFFVDRIGWRSAFFALLPLCFISTIIAASLLTWSSSGQNRGHAMRGMGIVEMLAFATATSTLFLSLSRLARTSKFHIYDIVWISGGLFISALSFWILLLTSYRAEHPIISIRMLLRKDIGSICLLNFLSGLSYHATLYATPYFLITVRGTSAAAAGLRLVPVSIIAISCSIICGAIVARTGRFKRLLLLGSTMPALGLLILIGDTRIRSETSSPFTTALEISALSLSAVGQDTINALSMVALLGVCDSSNLASCTSLWSLSKSYGGVVGTATSGIFLQVFLRVILREELQSEDSEKIIRIITSSIELIKKLPSSLQSIAREAWRQSFSLTCLSILVAAFFCWPMVLRLGWDEDLSSSQPDQQTGNHIGSTENGPSSSSRPSVQTGS